jgi:ATPase subunit of ABC transporter with duplicated ATPase domains
VCPNIQYPEQCNRLSSHNTASPPIGPDKPSKKRYTDAHFLTDLFHVPSAYQQENTLISTANITMQFGAKPLFENISIKFGDGNRYGLIGANGCGKSTFMKILDGSLEPTAGSVSVTPNERLGKLSQDQFAFEEYSVLDTVMMGNREMWAIKAERDAIYSNPEASEEDYMRAAELEGEFGELGGYMAESKAGELLLGAGIDTELHSGPMSEVAPGWKLRVLLAQALFSDPDILLLDEPTNNLDINTIRWLEGIINNMKCTMIIISHDRHFLNSVCTHMADIDYGQVKIYPGTYDDFMIASTAVRERMQSENAKKKAQIAELQQFVSRFSANASKAKQATSRAKQIDKIKLDDIKPSSRQSPFIRFTQEKKLHRQAVEINSLSHAYDGESPLFANTDLMIEAGEKIAVIGANGVGKTTFLKCLVDHVSPSSGTIKWAENADTGYYAQDHEYEFESNMTLYDWMSQWKTEEQDETAVRGSLGRLLFNADAIKKNIKVCSGGEKGRLLFGKLMMGNHNVLIMDEPTNHMDMESIESLNLSLEMYEGTLIFVSHDREFVSSLATRILEIRDNQIVDFHGTYDEYLKSQGVE